MKPCLALLLSMPEDVQRAVADRTETAMRVGVDQKAAQQAAIESLLADLDADEAELATALREQHPDLFRVDASREIIERVTGGNLEGRAMDSAGAAVLPRFAALGDERATVPQMVADAERIAGFSMPTPIEVAPLPENTVQQFDPETGLITVNRNQFQGRGLAAEALIEEWLHALDNAGPSRQISIGAARLAMEFTPQGLKATGDIAVEAMAQMDGKGSVIEQYLVYPLKSQDLTRSRTQAELFARLGVLYIAHPDIMRRAMPTAYEAYHELFTSLGRRSADRGAARVQGEVRRSGAVAGNEAVRDGGNDADVPGNPGAGRGQRREARLGAGDVQAFRRAAATIFGGRAEGGLIQGPLSARAPARPPGQFTLPEFKLAATAQQNLQDRYNRWKQAVDAVRSQGGNVNEANDFYREEERYWGRVGNQNEQFGAEIKAFAEAVHSDGLTLGQVAEYAYAKHAEERNASIAAKRADMPDGGSGMDTAEARQILAAAQRSGLAQALDRHAATLHEWIRGTRDVLERNGLISAAQRQAWEGQWQNYVPLRGLEGSPQKKGTGKGFDVRGPEGKRAAGRRSRASKIIEQIIEDRTRAYIRAGKNEVLRSFLAFVLDNPSANLWEVNAVRPLPVFKTDANGNEVIEMHDRIVTDSSTVTVKDGGQEIHILIKDEKLREQLQNLHVEHASAAVAAMLWANRKVGAMLTAYNPVFVALNGVRDFQAATIGMVDEAGYKGAGRFLLNYPRSMIEAGLAELLGKQTADYALFKSTGGTTGYFGLQDLSKTESDLQALVRNAERSFVNPIKLGAALADYVGRANSMVEQATRYAAFRAARRSGLSVARSASVSKNITVNFNRKGAWAPWLSAMMMFYNPAAQGTARLVQAVKNPKTWPLLGSGMVGLFALALHNVDWGGEDEDGVPFWDKVPREIKERNLVVMLRPQRGAGPDGKLESRYVKLPLAFGFNVFKVVADQVADQYRRQDDPNAGLAPAESAMRVALALIDAVQPNRAVGQTLENSESFALIPFSNALGPVAQAAVNQSSFGRPLFPDYPNERHLPDSEKFSAAHAGTIWQRSAQAMNAATGGSEYERGLIDIAPGSLENAARFYGGGISSFAMDLANAFYVRQHIERPDWDVRRLPFVKQLYGRLDAETDRWFAYERLNKAEALTQPFEKARDNADHDAAKLMEIEHGNIVRRGARIRSVRGKLADLRKKELSIIDDAKLSEAKKFAELTKISGEVREVLKDWNREFDKLIIKKPVASGADDSTDADDELPDDE